jgi:pilus assembly protein CpaE
MPVPVLIAGSTSERISALRDILLDQPRWRVTTLEAQKGNQLADALITESASPRPVRVVIVAYSDTDIGNLEALAMMDPAQRPPVIVCGALQNAEANRLAMRAGAADLLPAVPSKAELVAALERLVFQTNAVEPQRIPGRLTTILGASGGVGASFLATNLAHLSVVVWSHKTLLVDLDPVYVTLATALGLAPERGLLEALQNTDTLDTTAFEGYVTHHGSGLGLLACAEGLFTSPTIDNEAFPKLLHIALQAYEMVFVDGSRWLDSATTTALAMSQSIVLVTDQAVVQVRNTAKLYRILTQQMGLPASRITVVINRYEVGATVQPDMVTQAIGCDDVVLIPNMSKLALESMDTAVPLFELDRKSALTRALISLGERLMTGSPAKPTGLFSRAFSLIGRGS